MEPVAAGRIVIIGGNDDDDDGECIFGEGERNVDLSLRERERVGIFGIPFAKVLVQIDHDYQQQQQQT